MAASILLACGLNEKNLDSYIHISEESEIDGNFLISCILGQRLRVQECGTILICLHHTFQHYLNAGMRLGYNLNMFNGKNLHIIEPITDIAINFPTSKWISSINASENICEILLKDIQNVIANNFQTKRHLTIIIDNLEFLLNFNANEDDLIKFCKSLKGIIESLKGSSTLITKLNDSNVFDVLNNKLITLSDLHLNIVKLKSGNFKEVDGKLTITKNQLNGAFKIDKYEKNILYKVNERNIRTFNPGEIGIKT